MKLFSILSVVVTLTHAATTYHLDFLGFSDDGRYCAYTLSGTHDGSGFPFCIYRFVDVTKNSFVGKKISETDDDTHIEAVTAAGAPGCEDRAREKARILLDNFGISGSHPGKLVYETVLHAAEDAHGRTNCVFSHEDKQYQLKLREYPPPNLECWNSNYAPRPMIFELEIARGDYHQVLQHDTRLYRSRGCPYRYGIYRVYVYEKSLAVFLNSLTPGFEGPDIRRLVVTGTLPEPAE